MVYEPVTEKKGNISDHLPPDMATEVGKCVIVIITAASLAANRYHAGFELMCQEKSPPDPRAFLTNLTGPRPWTEKVRLLLRNNWLKLTAWRHCCGHPGEPGC